VLYKCGEAGKNDPGSMIDLMGSVKCLGKTKPFLTTVDAEENRSLHKNRVSKKTLVNFWTYSC
jgi:hypothetical protein